MRRCRACSGAMYFSTVMGLRRLTYYVPDSPVGDDNYEVDGNQTSKRVSRLKTSFTSRGLRQKRSLVCREPTDMMAVEVSVDGGYID